MFNGTIPKHFFAIRQQETRSARLSWRIEIIHTGQELSIKIVDFDIINKKKKCNSINLHKPLFTS